MGKPEWEGETSPQNHPEETENNKTHEALTITWKGINIYIFKKQWRDKDEKKQEQQRRSYKTQHKEG